MALGGGGVLLKKCAPARIIRTPFRPVGLASAVNTIKYFLIGSEDAVFSPVSSSEMLYPLIFSLT